MRETLHDYCVRTNMRYLLDEWDKEKNAPFTPDNVTRGSSRKVWWKCEKGHSYLTEIRLKTQGCKCPYCTNRMVIAEENSLAATNPELAAQWDFVRNGDLKPKLYASGMDKNVYTAFNDIQAQEKWTGSLFASGSQNTGEEFFADAFAYYVKTGVVRAKDADTGLKSQSYFDDLAARDWIY